MSGKGGGTQTAPAKPQGGGFFENLSDEDKKRMLLNFSQAAQLQPLGGSMSPVQRGGGMMGLMDSNMQQLGPSPSAGGFMTGEDDELGIDKIMGLLERAAKLGKFLS